jgi:hypothetical protein
MSTRLICRSDGLTIHNTRFRGGPGGVARKPADSYYRSGELCRHSRPVQDPLHQDPVPRRALPGRVPIGVEPIRDDLQAGPTPVPSCPRLHYASLI